MKQALCAAFIAAFAATFLACISSAHGAGTSCAGKHGKASVGLICVRHGSENPGNNDSQPTTRSVDCGRPGVGRNAGSWNVLCGAPLSCFSIDPRTGGRTQPDAIGVFAVDPLGVMTLVPVDVYCPGLAQPEVTAASVREQVLRLLPRVGIGSAWPGTALVNAETVLWAKTDSARRLPVVSIVGRRVQLRIGFDHATWTYGDGSSATTSDPGKAYDKVGDPCNTAQCADYGGHTYTKTGTVRLGLSVAWRAQFSVNGGATWTDVDAAALTGPAVTTTLVLKQARGVLVPNP